MSFSYADAVTEGANYEATDEAAPAYAEAVYGEDQAAPEYTEPAYGEEQAEAPSYDPSADAAGDEAVEAAIEAAGDSVHSAAAQLWGLDAPNRLTPGVDYEINTQYKAHSYHEDEASESLFSFVSDEVWSRPTYASFKRLLDNYTAETGHAERVSDEERLEEKNFLDVICDTPVMRFTQRWLSENCDNGDFGNMDDFKQVLYGLWFQLYGRDGSNDSSGFEHAFCGEIDDGKVKGLHNFIQVYKEEQNGNFNYMGFLEYGRQRDDVDDGDRLLTIRFKWLGYVKAASSMFVGVSPEFEFALYTLMWLSGSAGEVVELGAWDVCVKVYDMYGNVGAAFPELVAVDYNEAEAEY